MITPDLATAGPRAAATARPGIEPAAEPSRVGPEDRIGEGDDFEAVLDASVPGAVQPEPPAPRIAPEGTSGLPDAVPAAADPAPQGPAPAGVPAALPDAPPIVAAEAQPPGAAIPTATADAPAPAPTVGRLQRSLPGAGPGAEPVQAAAQAGPAPTPPTAAAGAPSAAPTVPAGPPPALSTTPPGPQPALSAVAQRAEAQRSGHASEPGRARQVRVDAPPATAPRPATFSRSAASAAFAQTLLAADAAGQAPSGAEWRLGAEPPHTVRLEAAAPQPLQPQAVAGQITLAIGRADSRQVEIRLDPPELGRVQIHLSPGEDGLHAVVTAERPETQDFLRRHAEVLARDLGAAGYDNVTLDFAGGGRTAARQDEARAAAVLADAPAPAAEETPGSPAPRPAGGGLDIRL